jgi:hypothetical protein
LTRVILVGTFEQSGQGGAKFTEGSFDRTVGELRKDFFHGDGNECARWRRLDQFCAQIHWQHRNNG